MTLTYAQKRDAARASKIVARTAASRDTQLAARFSAKLTASLLNQTDVRLMELQLCPAGAQAERYSLNASTAGFVIPYFDAAGKPTGEGRFRALWDGNFNADTAKAQRYCSPAGSTPQVYFPKHTDWKRHLAATDNEIVITEGELKAACACKHALPTVGLSGVYSFRDKTGALLPALRAISWHCRSVTIAFDSDAATNVQVQAAEIKLAHELLKLGAYVRRVRLPALTQGKTGLDDYIVAKGIDALKALIKNQSEGFPEAAALFALNEEVVLVRDYGVVERATGKRMTVKNFIEVDYATRTYTTKVETVKTTRIVEHSAPKEWIKWPARYELRGAIYRPCAPDVKAFEEIDGMYNTWRGWGCQPAPGSVEPWTELLDHMFAGKPPAERQWFERWLAYPLQYAGAKLYSAALLWGANTGTGKSLIGYTMFKIYGNNSVEINERELHSGFNEWAVNRQFVMSDELTSGGASKKTTADYMKSMITRERYTINKKYLPTYEADDRINYYLTSNHCDAAYLEDKDRRYFIEEITSEPLTPPFRERYVAWLNGAGPAALFYHLLHLDMGGFNPKSAALATEDKREMTANVRSPLNAWVLKLLHAPDEALLSLSENNSAPQRSMFSMKDLIPYAEHYTGKRPSVHELSRAMKTYPKVNKGYVVQGRKGQVNYPTLYAVRDRDVLLTLGQPALHARHTKEWATDKKAGNKF